MKDVRKVVPNWFPRISKTEWEPTSPCDDHYNCISYAADIDHLRYWPNAKPAYQWPDGIPNEHSLEAFRALYQKIGYTDCASGDYELGFDKVAIYANKDKVTHAAIFKDGKWRSKLGPAWDISHELDALNGKKYGKPIAFLKRPVTLSPA